MSHTLQQFFAAATHKAANDVREAVLQLPADKRDWQPADSSRSALHQAAECAIMNGLTANVLVTREWPTGDMEGYEHGVATLAHEEEKLLALLEENTGKLTAAIRDFPDDALEAETQLPWGSQTFAAILAYPHWNMAYHTGQINYIASLLGL